MVSAEWQRLIDEKRATRDSLIPKEARVSPEITSKVREDAHISAFELLRESNLLTAREIEITEKYDATALLGKLSSGEISSVEVTAAFCKRTAIGIQFVCLTNLVRSGKAD
jgi:amidase